MSAKRSLFKTMDSLKDVEQTDNAVVHGVIANVSDMKQGAGRPFFEAKLTDGEKQLRVVGFTSGQQKRLSTSQSTMDSVALENCQVKRAKYSDDMEIVLRSTSKVQSSPKKFSKEKIAVLMNEKITLDSLGTKNEYDKVTVSAKVIRIDEPTQVSGNLTKQDLIIADATAAAKITLWEDRVDTIDEGDSYEFKNVNVRSFKQEKYLSVSKKATTITLIPDLENVAEDDVPDNSITINDTRVVAATLNSYSTCIACKSKVKVTDADIMYCTKCQMAQLKSSMSTEVSAVLFISTDDVPIRLSAFRITLGKIVRGQELTVPHLLAALPFNCTHQDGIITNVTFQS